MAKKKGWLYQATWKGGEYGTHEDGIRDGDKGWVQRNPHHPGRFLFYRLGEGSAWHCGEGDFAPDIPIGEPEIGH
jgi:hypothetical protein